MVKTNFIKFDSEITFSFETIPINNKSFKGNNEIKTFFDNLKNDTVNKVFSMSHSLYGFQKSKIALNEFYCNPYNEYDILSIKNNSDINIPVSVEISISGIWLSEKSFGSYIKLVKSEIIKNENKFIDSDSDEEIETVLKNIQV
jgi:hypothetical protein